MNFVLLVLLVPTYTYIYNSLLLWWLSFLVIYMYTHVPQHRVVKYLDMPKVRPGKKYWTRVPWSKWWFQTIHPTLDGCTCKDECSLWLHPLRVQDDMLSLQSWSSNSYPVALSVSILSSPKFAKIRPGNSQALLDSLGQCSIVGGW